MLISRNRQKARIQLRPSIENLEIRQTPARAGVGLHQLANVAASQSSFAPYVDMTSVSQWKQTPYMVDAQGHPSLTALMNKTGVKDVTLAFVNAKMVNGHVVPIWGSNDNGYTFDSPEGRAMMAKVAAAAKAGLKITISFGGIAACDTATGNEIGQLTANNPAEMKRVYSSVISRFYKMGIRNFDFDIEGNGNKSAAAQAVCKTRFDVLKQIQNDPHFRGMNISFVLAISPTDGWAPSSWDGMFIRSAAASGLKVSHWNMMAFDYGPQVNNYMRQNGLTMLDALKVEADTGGDWQTGAWPNPIKGAADYLVQYGLAANRQDAFSKLGVTLMIGQDDATVVPAYPSPGYQTGDADVTSATSVNEVNQILDWARQNQVGVMSFWSLNRDRPYSNTMAYNPQASPAFTTSSRYSPSQDSAFATATGTSTTVTYSFSPPVTPASRQVVSGAVYHNNGPSGYGGEFRIDTATRNVIWDYVPPTAPQPVSATIAPDWSSLTVTYSTPPTASTKEFVKLNFAPKIIRDYQSQDLAYTQAMLGYGATGGVARARLGNRARGAFASSSLRVDVTGKAGANALAEYAYQKPAGTLARAHSQLRGPGARARAGAPPKNTLGSTGNQLPNHFFAPYIDMTALQATNETFGNTYDFSNAYNALGGQVKTFLLSFVNGAQVNVNGKQQWVAAWTSGSQSNPQDFPVDLTYADANPNMKFWSGVLKNSVQGFESKGATPVIVFGGNYARPLNQDIFRGNELALKITDVNELAKQYESVITQYGARVLDFDIEWTYGESQDVVDRRNAALAIVQKDFPDVQIGYTIPGAPEVGVRDYTRLLSSARAKGVNISFVNIMTMSFGPYYTNRATEFDLIKQTIDHAIPQIARAYTNNDLTAARHLIGITPMVGSGDYSNANTEIFFLNNVPANTYSNYAGTPLSARPSDARLLLNYAEKNGFRMLSEWSLGRDQPYSTLSSSLQTAVQNAYKWESPTATANSTDPWSVKKPAWTFANPPQIQSSKFAYANLFSAFNTYSSVARLRVRQR